MEIIEQKKQLRKLIREKKYQFSFIQKLAASKPVFEQLEQLPEFVKAQTVLLYWSMKDEIHTHDFILKWYQQKNIILPLVDGDSLQLRQFTGMDCMVEGTSFGILEPGKGPVADVSKIELGVIPGIAFDRMGNRMGRGKGYYDKLLIGRPFYTVGVCFDFQMVEQVPVDINDVPLHKVIHS